MIDSETGTLIGGADPRRGGLAVAYQATTRKLTPSSPLQSGVQHVWQLVSDNH